MSFTSMTMRGALVAVGVTLVMGVAAPIPGGADTPAERPDTCPTSANRGLAGTSDPLRSAGIDISSHQHADGLPIDWKTVAAARDFVIIKATQDFDYTNPWVCRDYRGAANAGLITGFYHYPNFSTSATDQAKYFVAQIKAFKRNGLANTITPMLDVEEGQTNITEHTPTELQKWIREYVGTIRRLTGRKTMIYTRDNLWREYLDNTTEFNSLPLDISYWPRDPEDLTPPALPGGWTTWTFWQYASDGVIDGITGDVDLDRYNVERGPIRHALRDSWPSHPRRGGLFGVS